MGPALAIALGMTDDEHGWTAAPFVPLRSRRLPTLADAARGCTGCSSTSSTPSAIGASRRRIHDIGGRATVVTYHPSAVLRAGERAAEVRAAPVADLRTLPGLLPAASSR